MRRPLARSLVVSRRPGLFYGSAVQDYLDRVRAADGAGLERGVTDGINTYLSGLIAANLLGTSGGVISQAASIIKAHCILSGANTLTGALVPVVGPAPTNFNFTPGDYNRKTGLGDSANVSKYLDSNRNNNADPQDNQHMSVYVGAALTSTATRMFIGVGGSTGATGATHINYGTTTQTTFRNRNSATTVTAPGIGTQLGFYGMNRQSSANFNYRTPTLAATVTQSSQVPFNGSIQVFANEASRFYDGRFTAYTIGEGLDLAVLLTLQDQLMATFAASIP